VGPYRLRGKHQGKIVIGSGNIADSGWVPTEQSFLDLLKAEDWERFFQPNSLDAMLAEHVWEHLTVGEAYTAAWTCYRYLKPGGYLRVAVPDGLHPNPDYHGWVKVGGAIPGQISNDHKVLYTYRTLSDVFTSAGFRVDLYEYFDEEKNFHYREWDAGRGKIRRSSRYDKRNRDGSLTFTSIILDAVKPV
jgi:predicted SAM-dependent methyltransferase